MGRTGGDILRPLYSRIQPYFNQSDDRGSILGLLNTGTWREMNIISSEAGAVRGNHYHMNTEECFFILSGRIRVVFRRPLDSGGWEEDEKVFIEGDVFVVYPNVEHVFYIMQDSHWINLLSDALDKDHPDIHRYQ